jgi:hypothetical protein
MVEAGASSPGPKDESELELASYGRRMRAAVAYCREVFPLGIASARAEQILSSLSGGISDERVLLELTRTAAGKLLGEGDIPDNAQAPAPECGGIFSRLAARANGMSKAGERLRLEQHLAACVVCKAAELRAARAERAFAAILGLTLNG